MNKKASGIRQEVRYSEAFKLEVVRELESGHHTFTDMAMKYGIKGAMTVANWVRKHGNGSRGKVIRVENLERL
jgi:transposase